MTCRRHRSQKTTSPSKFTGRRRHLRLQVTSSLPSSSRRPPICHARIPIRPDWWIRTEVLGARLSILYIGTFVDLFFLRVVPVPVGVQTSSVITKIIYIYQKNYHRSGVHHNLYTYTESHYLYNYLYMYIFNSVQHLHCLQKETKKLIHYTKNLPVDPY